MAHMNIPMLQFISSTVSGSRLNPSNSSFPLQTVNLMRMQLAFDARANAKRYSAKTRNRRMQKKFNGTSKKPRLSVFCSEKQLYATLVDDHNKKCLFYGSTLQKCFWQDPPCTTSEAAQRVGEALVKACVDLNITEISYYDRNGFAHGERMRAFELAISRHGFLPG